MANPRRQRGALQLIFAFFLGLMVTAFIGVGVYTFYPPGLERFQDETRVLYDQQQQIRDARRAEGLTEAEQAKLAALAERTREAEKEMRDYQENWARMTSIILIVLATFVMAVSLIRADQLPVINNGLLLGGVFTMLYGTGWILWSGDSRARFWVMAFALLITLLLGYIRFVRGRAAKEPEDRPPAQPGDLEARVAALERKLAAAAEAIAREASPEKDR